MSMQKSSLDGLWSSSSGGVKTVKNGCFGGSQIALEQGKLVVNDYVAVAVSEKEVTWERNGQQVKWTRLRVQDLDGFWSSSSGGVKMVKNGCFGGSQIALEQGKLVVNHYVAVAVSEKEVTWESNGQQVKWTRLKLQGLDGFWLSSSGGIKQVKDGCFSGHTIKLKQGKWVVDGYIAMAMSEKEVVWEQDDHQISWTRILPQSLDGYWSSSSGGIKTVADGCFGDSEIALEQGELMVNDHVAVAMSEKEVTWERNGQQVKWTRLQVQYLYGFWSSSSGGIKQVQNGCFAGSQISVEQRKWMINGYLAIALSPKCVTWERDGQQVKWHRLQAKDLDGTWLSSSGGIKTVKDGYFGGSSIVVEDGKCMVNDYVAVAISEKEVTWERDGCQIKWKRSQANSEIISSPRSLATAKIVPTTSRLEERKARLSSRENLMMLCHATSLTNAEKICYEKDFRPGSHGFLGPGIYFSADPCHAMRWCQCRGGPIVILRCKVNMGAMRCVSRGWYTWEHLLTEGVDSLKEMGRDCYMLPNNDSQQICMNSIQIDYL